MTTHWPPPPTINQHQSKPELDHIVKRLGEVPKVLLVVNWIGRWIRARSLRVEAPHPDRESCNFRDGPRFMRWLELLEGEGTTDSQFEEICHWIECLGALQLFDRYCVHKGGDCWMEGV